MKIQKTTFYPVSKINQKNNVKPIYIIHEDGIILERICLSVSDPRLREFIICSHYFKKNNIKFDIIWRDNPWDFQLETQYKESLNVEITSVADDKLSFKNWKERERLDMKSPKKRLPIRELSKLNSLFPLQWLQQNIAENISKGLSQDDLIESPYYLEKNHWLIVVSSKNRTKQNLEELLLIAILKKESKKHKNKESTILIIDNRTFHYEIPDFNNAINNIHHIIKNTDFREIWMYTGYYSNDDWTNAEFSFIPIK